MNINYAGVDFPYHSSDFLRDSMAGYFGRMGDHPERNLFFGSYAYKLNLKACLPGVGSVSDGVTYGPHGWGYLWNDGDFFIDGGAYNRIMDAVNRTGGLGALTVTDDHATLKLGTMYLARRRLIRDATNDAERVWLITLFNGNQVWGDGLIYNYALGDAASQIHPDYVVDQPESWANLCRYTTARQFSTENGFNNAFRLGLQLALRLNQSGTICEYGLPRTLRVDTANSILNRNIERWGGRLIHGQILATEREGADHNRCSSIAVPWTNVNALGSTVTSGSTDCRLIDVYPDLTPWPDAHPMALTISTAAVAQGSTNASNLAFQQGRSWYRWAATALRIHGGHPGFFPFRWDENQCNSVTFAGLVPWEFSGIEGAVYLLAGAGEWEIPCTVVTGHTYVVNHRHRRINNTSMTRAIAFGSIGGTRPTALSAVRITRNETGHQIQQTTSGSSWSVTGVPDGVYTVTPVGAVTPASATVTISNAGKPTGDNQTVTFTNL